jgi:nitrous oxide reductase|tara:strand:- start:1945 stop:2130 length:186 start_codon:yes stop_codon:yes gene_type:complete
MESNKPKNGRRDFLKGAAITAAATVAVSVSNTASADEKMNTTGAGYQKTKHVKAYYETARF